MKMTMPMGNWKIFGCTFECVKLRPVAWQAGPGPVSWTFLVVK